jgi:hypothetical protein
LEFYFLKFEFHFDKGTYHKVLGPKAQGALNLHKATQQHSPAVCQKEIEKTIKA